MTNVENWLPEYEAVLGECLEISAVKLSEYGVSWREYRVVTAVDNALIKACRIRELEEMEARGDSAMIGEGRRSEYLGIINYACIALVIIRNVIIRNKGLGGIAPEEAQRLMSGAAGEARELMIKKTHDYGDAWRLMDITSITDTIIARCNRVKDLLKAKGQTLSEGADAQLLDIINYAAFAVMKLAC